MEQLTEFLNKLNDLGSIKFTYEMESDDKLLFLDVLIIRKDNGEVKLHMYRKPTHSDQYLNFSSQLTPPH